MSVRVLAAMILLAGCSLVTWAQEPVRMPSSPAAGAPGTANPQPYGQPSSPSPIKRQGSAPLLPPSGGQALPGATPRQTPDQPIPSLQRQLERNSQGLEGQRQPRE